MRPSSPAVMRIASSTENLSYAAVALVPISVLLGPSLGRRQET